MIAALYVQTGGAYFGLPGVDPWDATRDARLYAGPDPVVAHPPCARWCRLAGLVQARYPHLRKGEDGGCFAHALGTVREFGGVLEHPAYSDAWAAFGLARPSRAGGWSESDAYGGRACHVNQSQYGHVARKATWLYAVGVDFPDLRWGRGPEPTHACGYGFPNDGSTKKRAVRSLAITTPPAFKEILLAMARSVTRREVAA